MCATPTTMSSSALTSDQRSERQHNSRGPYVSFITNRTTNLFIRGGMLFFVGVFLALVLNLLQVQRNVTLFHPDVISSIFSSVWWVPPSCGTASAMIGMLYPCIDRRLGKPHNFKREWSSVMRCVAVFVGINHASAMGYIMSFDGHRICEACFADLTLTPQPCCIFLLLEERRQRLAFFKAGVRRGDGPTKSGCCSWGDASYAELESDDSPIREDDSKSSSGLDVASQLGNTAVEERRLRGCSVNPGLCMSPGSQLWARSSIKLSSLIEEAASAQRLPVSLPPQPCLNELAGRFSSAPSRRRDPQP